jgi:hypothetical protein
MSLRVKLSEKREVGGTTITRSIEYDGTRGTTPPMWVLKWLRSDDIEIRIRVGGISFQGVEVPAEDEEESEES